MYTFFNNPYLLSFYSFIIIKMSIKKIAVILLVFGILSFEPATFAESPVNPAVTAGWSDSFLLKDDGSVWSWGLNNYGQLGNGTVAIISEPRIATPVQVTNLSGITSIAAGLYHTLALKNDGTVWAWGTNDFGQLGDGTKVDKSTPVQVKGLSDITAISASKGISSFFSMALKNDGTVWAWGSAWGGQLGDGTTPYETPEDKTTPVQVLNLSKIIAISIGNGYSLALKRDGTVWAWGLNSDGQIGDGTTELFKINPVQVFGLNEVIAISAGEGHALALKRDGTVWAWGKNDVGELGDGGTTERNTPVQVLTLTGVKAISANFGHSMALKNDGTIWVWGLNDSGQLGDGTVTNSSEAKKVTGLEGIIAIASGAQHSMAVQNDGTVWTWGSNSEGELGDGTTIEKTTPVKVLFEFVNERCSSFSDVTESHTLYNVIQYVKSAGIFEGYPDCTFRPDSFINRAETVKVILNGFKIEIQTTFTDFSTPFLDINLGDWFFGYVVTAKNNGILQGYPDGTFKPANTVNFAEMIKIFVNSSSLQSQLMNLNTVRSDICPAISDRNTWYLKYFQVAKDAKLITDNDCVSASNPATRAAMANLFYDYNENGY